jgi:hypothetical protein
MNKFVSGLLATTLAISFATAAAVPANAASIYVPQTRSMMSDNSASNIVNVDYVVRRHHWRGGNRVYRHNGGHYWHGHRGYRHWRHGYRRHGDLWFPLAAFAAGALVTGAIVNDRPVYGSSHEARCYARYRSYRAYDNTYQPYDGPRRQCTL